MCVCVCFRLQVKSVRQNVNNSKHFFEKTFSICSMCHRGNAMAIILNVCVYQSTHDFLSFHSINLNTL